MKAPFSSYLQSLEPSLKQLVDLLERDFAYVSVLAADSPALTAMIVPGRESLSSQALTAERGLCVRCLQDGHVREYSLNAYDPAHPETAMEEIKTAFAAQDALLKETSSRIYDTAVPMEKKKTLFVEKEASVLPEKADGRKLLHLMEAARDQAEANSVVQACVVRVTCTHVSKMFLSSRRNLKQSYVYCEALTAVMGVNERGENIQGYCGDSGLCGLELTEELPELTRKAVAQLEELAHAEHIVPGEYEIITTPAISGVIAHEAFGHGMEMDMFVKNRALAKEYMGQRVGSDLVTMHEGALCAENVASYAFDDEGVLAGDVTEIDHGILKNGICDALSAARLHTIPTGNGRRQNFEHKAYTRMTNTLFDAGTNSLEEMIASIPYGYLVDGLNSGMEDPKHWGIQIILSLGREIKDGKLTGKVVSPIIMTGYVPDLLRNICMISRDSSVFGTGYCGKGYKEFVKVADGGPYLKTKARLG